MPAHDPAVDLPEGFVRRPKIRGINEQITKGAGGAHLGPEGDQGVRTGLHQRRQHRNLPRRQIEQLR